MSRKIEGIQVARGIAAVGVLLFHSNLMIREIPDAQKIIIPFVYFYGAIGVQLFFVISGFIIAYVLQREQFNAGAFLTKRAIRIYPVYIAATAVALYFHWHWKVPFHIEQSPEFLVKSLVLFPQKTLPFFQPGWTLVHEVIFYLFAAMIFPIFGLHGLMWIMAATGGVGLALHMADPDLWTYNILSFYNLYFAAGIALAVYRNHLARIHWSAALIVAVIVMTTYVQSYTFAAAYYANWAVRTAHYIVACSALCVALLNLPPIKGRVWRFAVFLGTISYSIYLVHWIVIRLMIRVRVGFGLNDYPEAVRWSGILISIGLAAVVWYIVEQPTNAYGRRIATRLFGGKPLTALRTGVK